MVAVFCPACPQAAQGTNLAGRRGRPRALVDREKRGNLSGDFSSRYLDEARARERVRVWARRLVLPRGRLSLVFYELAV
jgi:hypothetical protein